MFQGYAKEELHPDDDDGTMVENVDCLANQVVGHKIVSAERVKEGRQHWYDAEEFVITLDTGKKVKLSGGSDCCAFTDLEDFLLHADKIDHVITGIGTTDGYQTWHIFCDLGDVLELQVGWSCGNPFYYGYGFSITVEDVN